MVNESTLVTLATLRVSIDDGRDYLCYLYPFVKNVLREYGNKPVVDTDISMRVEQEYGLSIPPSIIQIVLKRLSRSGVLYRENNAFWVKSIKEDFCWKERMDKSYGLIRSLLRKFITFVESNNGIVIDENEAISCFKVFLSKFSISCLKAFVKKTAFPLDLENKDWQIVAVSNFLKNIADKDCDAFQQFILLVEGNMLANALLCSDLNSLQSSYKDVIFYFDTQILLEIIGLLGHDAQQAAIELIKIIRQLGGECRYFSHTLDEMITVVNASIDNFDSPEGYGRIIRIARTEGLSRVDLVLALSKSEDVFKKHNLYCAETPKYYFDYQIDENEFADILDEELYYRNPRAKDCDINSVRCIYSLRKGAVSVNIEKCKAIFVTGNTLFAKAAYEYNKKIENLSSVTPVITTFSLMNISWLKAPLKCSKLPLYEILAFSYAALIPPQKFWEDVLAKAEILVQQNEMLEIELQILRSDPHFINEIFTLTAGNDVELSLSIKERMEKYRADIVADKQNEIDRIIEEKEELIKKNKDVVQQNRSLIDKNLLYREGVKKNIKEQVTSRVELEGKIISVLIWIIVAMFSLFVPLNELLGNFFDKYIVDMVKIISVVIMTGVGYWISIRGENVKKMYCDYMLEKRLCNKYKLLEVDSIDSDSK